MKQFLFSWASDLSATGSRLTLRPVVATPRKFRSTWNSFSLQMIRLKPWKPSGMSSKLWVKTFISFKNRLVFTSSDFRYSLTGRPKWPSSITSISKTSTTKTSTFYPKTLTGKNIDWLKDRLAITSISIFSKLSHNWEVVGLKEFQR